MADQAVPRRLTKVTLQALDWLLATLAAPKINQDTSKPDGE